MAQTIKDANGNEIEVFTADEVKAQNEAALEQYQKDHPDQSAAIQSANEAKVAAERALAEAIAAGGNDKDQNFAALRAAVKSAEDKAEKARTDALSEIEKIKNAPTVEYRGELFDQLSVGDKVVKEKIQIHYNNLAGMPEGTKAEVRARMEAAYKLAVDKPAPGMFDNGVAGAGARGQGGMGHTVAGQEGDNAKAIRGVLGISDEHATKYAPKPGQPGYQA